MGKGLCLSFCIVSIVVGGGAIGRLSAVRMDYRVAQIHKTLSGGLHGGSGPHQMRHNPA